MKKELNPAQVSAILRTLPVGFYLGTRAPVVLDLGAPSSFVNLMTREVHVAFRNVSEAFAAAPEVPEADLEGVIRGLLYHEISHLLLTPVRVSPADHLGKLGNILEDARIETLLANHFHGVNFRDLLRRVCGEPVTPAKDFDHFVFNAVRYRIAPADLLAKWDALVRKHCGNPEADGARFDEYVLVRDYRVFLEEARKAFEAGRKPQPPMENPKNAPENGGNAGAPKAGKDGAGNGAGKDGEGKDQENGGNGEGAGKDKDAGKEDKGAGAKPENGANGGQNAREGGARNTRGGGRSDGEAGAAPAAGAADPCPDEIAESELEGAKKRFAARLKRYENPAVSREVSRIIVRATNKRANRTGVRHGFSGKLVPRAIATRRDFRWWGKSGDDGCGKFDRIALRLVVDCSGSFSGSVRKVNELVSSLLEVEKKMPNAFALSVVVTGDWTRVHDKTRRIEADEGNDFGPGVVEAFRETEKPGWRNVTVAVWDGGMSHEAFHEARFRGGPDSGALGASKKKSLGELKNHIKTWKRAYEALNTRDTVIVSDPDNKTAFELGCPNARKSFIGGNYATVFVGKVLDLLGGIL